MNTSDCSFSACLFVQSVWTCVSSESLFISDSGSQLFIFPRYSSAGLQVCRSQLSHVGLLRVPCSSFQRPLQRQRATLNPSASYQLAGLEDGLLYFFFLYFVRADTVTENITLSLKHSVMSPLLSHDHINNCLQKLHDASGQKDHIDLSFACLFYLNTHLRCQSWVAVCPSLSLCAADKTSHDMSLHQFI